MERIAVCPGSFDPITNGHMDIIRRAYPMFDKIVVLVSYNPEKQSSFTVSERKEMILEATKDLPNVVVDEHSGLLVDYLKEKNINTIIRGLRAVSDFEYEFQMAMTNKKLLPSSETIFLTASAENMYLSSSVVRQVAGFGGSIEDFVPPVLHQKICDKLYPKTKE